MNAESVIKPPTVRTIGIAIKLRAASKVRSSAALRVGAVNVPKMVSKLVPKLAPTIVRNLFPIRSSMLLAGKTSPVS